MFFFPFGSGLYSTKKAVREKKKIPLENKYIFSSSFEVFILHLRLCCMDSINFLKTSVVMLKE